MQFMEIMEAFLCAQGVRQESSKGRHSDSKTGRKNPQTEGWPLGGALYQKTHYR